MRYQRPRCVLVGMWGGLALMWLCALPGAMRSAWSDEARPFHYDAHGRRDPFEPLISATGELRTPRSGGAAGSLHVEGILWDAQQPLAIINGEVRRIGDEVEGFRITDIRTQAIMVDGPDADHLSIPVVTEGLDDAP